MPETELNELLGKLKGLIDWSDEQARAEAVEALKRAVNPLYMAINNLGFGAAQAKLQKQVEDADTAKQEAVTRAEAAETKLREYENKAPDVAAVNKQWEAKVEEIKDAHKKEIAKFKATIRNGWIQRDQKELEGELVKLGVPKAMARTVSKDPDYISARGDYDDHGALSVRQAGQQIPFTPGSGQTHLSLLAEEIVTNNADVKEMLESGGDRGSGVTGGNLPGGGDKAFYENLRKSVKNGVGDNTPSKPLRERVQGR